MGQAGGLSGSPLAGLGQAPQQLGLALGWPWGTRVRAWRVACHHKPVYGVALEQHRGRGVHDI